MKEYNEQFKEWLDSSIIEVVDEPDHNSGHYLAHHAVVRESSLTTKIRPVFDASACINKESLSLNECLEKGSNYIELIPSLLIKFRHGSIGIVADIKKAFLQISVNEEDRNFLKFLWWRDIHQEKKTVVTYRHRRVVFGVTTSPFLLMATINHHLEKYESDTANKLKSNFYCDNCIVSVEDEESMNKFINEAKEIMHKGKFELRCWVTGPVITDDTISVTSVLGLNWDPRSDELFCKVPSMNENNIMTKRTLLSIAQSIFDPIGFISPCTIVPKILIQKCWKIGLEWDKPLPMEIQHDLKNWIKYLNLLTECRIPRHLFPTSIEFCSVSLHIFSDSSLSAYSGCVFLRTEFDRSVYVQLVIAKSRVTPSKAVTVPRSELIAAVLATRLAVEAKKSINLERLKEYYWTDSSIVLAWIKRKSGLNIFVHNRVKEILDKTNVEDWRHIPGHLNPADLPSRGCNAQVLLNSRWWEGPSWLRNNIDEWPCSVPELNEEEYIKEIKVNCLVTEEVVMFSDRLTYFSKYIKTVRMIGWCIRFKENCLKQSSTRTKGNLSSCEFEKAEKRLFALIQNEHFNDIRSTMKCLNMELVKSNEDGILRVKTRLTLRDDTDTFIFPILLPGSNKLVQNLIRHKHIELCHAGSQLLISNIREFYWVMGIRQICKRIVRECVVCKRYNARRCSVPPAPLPIGRTNCGAAFDVTGVDFAGPLYLRDNEKHWIVVFTCASYRAIHLELCKSLSTEDFMLAFRRFIARRGKPKTVYSDNGTNFRGTSNLLNSIDWERVSLQTTSHKIEWRFNPPQAPWWGGFWERMIKTIKEMLRRILGKACLDFTSLLTILCEVECIINNRPLTYIADDTENLKPLTPAMFLQDLKQYDTVDLDQADAHTLNTKVTYLQKLRKDFKSRFRSEYLSLLKQLASNKSRIIKVGDIVLVELESKRVDWPLAVVTAVFPGADGIVRVARVKTAMGEKIRPLQRLFPLEVPLNSPMPNPIQTDPVSPQLETQQTRCGRSIKIPQKLDL